MGFADSGGFDKMVFGEGQNEPHQKPFYQNILNQKIP
jgi:hypothetical protein